MSCKQIREAIDTATRRTGYSQTIKTHLSECPDCRRHADETSSLVELLSAQPRVGAPADFEFYLRARIARAKAEKSQVGMLEKFWQKSFSFGQAATAMAAIAVAVTASTFYYNHKNEMATTVIPEVAVTAPPVATTTDLPTGIKLVASGSKHIAVKQVVPRATAASNRSVKLVNAQPAAATTMIARDDSNRVYANGRVIRTAPRDTIIGAEGAAFAKAQTPVLSF
jgi:hypothetical protein